MNRKWRNVSDLCERIVEDDTLDDCYKDLSCLTYAPNIGCRCWIFRYKGTLVSLGDLGNGHYSFFSIVSVVDLIVAKLSVLKNDFLRIRDRNKGCYRKR